MPSRELDEAPRDEQRWLLAELAAVRDVAGRLRAERAAARTAVAELEAELGRTRDTVGTWTRWTLWRSAPRPMDEVMTELDAARARLTTADEVLRRADRRADVLASGGTVTTLADALAHARALQPNIEEAAELTATTQREELVMAVAKMKIAVSTLPRAERAVAHARCGVELLHASFGALGRDGAFYAHETATVLERLRAAGRGPGVEWNQHVKTAAHAYAGMLL